MKQDIARNLDRAELRGFGNPDEVREFPKGRLELIKVGGITIGRAVFEPGWKWSTSVQPIANTKELRSTAFSVSRVGSAENQNGRRN